MAPPTLEGWIAALASGHDVRLDKAAVRQSAHGKGLFASEPVKRGDVVTSVPKKLTLLIQDGNALALPGDGAWPRVRAGASAAAPDSGKGWEFILARAIVDAVAGDGGAFWEQYGGVMPAPETLAHPFLLSDDMLAQLQDDAMAARARDERKLIEALMPDLTTTQHAMETDSAVTVGAWALALVRSRAMTIGVGAHAVVPFLDCANHASVPNVDYRCDSIATPADVGIAPQAPQDMDRVEMIALTDADANEPLVLAYTKGNLTTEEHFEQYGFVASAYGSPLDRIQGLPRPPRAGTRAVRLKAALKAAVREDLARVWSDLEAREKEKEGSGGGALDERGSIVAAGASIRAALGDDEGIDECEDMTVGEEIAHLDALRSAAAELESNFPSTLEDDRTALRTLGEEGDERMGNVLRLRVCRKALVRRVRDVLDGLIVE